MQKVDFRFNGLLKPNEIEQIRSCLGNSLIGVAAEKGVLHINETLSFQRLEALGLCNLLFTDKNRNLNQLSLSSLFTKPNFPVVEHGSLIIEHLFIQYKPLSSRIKEPREIAPFGFHLDFHVKNINNIKFLGNKQQGFINELDPSIEMGYLKKEYQLDFYPFVELNSIEAVIFEDTNENTSIILILQETGFIVFLNQKHIPEDIVLENYLKINGYEKNIVLQHEISLVVKESDAS